MGSSLGIEELESRLAIDKNNLDTEVIEQPEVFYHAAIAAAEASAEYDSLKELSKQVYATVYSEIRSASESTGKKATEAMLSAQTEIDPRVVSAKNALTEALREKELSDARKEAFIQRGWMLKELCNMYVSGFLSATTLTTSNKDRLIEKTINERRALVRAAKTK